MPEETEPIAEESDTEHLEDLPDGAGCTEIWEHISETRDGGKEETDAGRESESPGRTGE